MMRQIVLEVEGHQVLVSVDDQAPSDEDESPVAFRRHALEPALRGAAKVARMAADQFGEQGCTEVTVEVGLEFAVESGTLLAVLGKASSTSTLTVTATYALAPAAADGR